MDESYIERDSYSTFIDDHDLRSLGLPEENLKEVVELLDKKCDLYEDRWLIHW